jgi:hypothetical protein
MQGDELLAMTPEALAKAILERRERMFEHLPKALEQRTEENDRAYRLSSEARAEFNALQADDSSTDENDLNKAKATYDEHEAFRRRTASRLQNVKNKIADCEEALAFWNTMSDGGWGHLLEDAERLNSGGSSTYAKPQNDSPKGDES